MRFLAVAVSRHFSVVTMRAERERGEIKDVVGYAPSELGSRKSVAGLNDIKIPDQETQRCIMARNRPSEGLREIGNKRGYRLARQRERRKTADGMHGACGRIRWRQYAGAADAIDHVLAELLDRCDPASQHAESDDISSSPGELARHSVMRRRS